MFRCARLFLCWIPGQARNDVGPGSLRLCRGDPGPGVSGRDQGSGALVGVGEIEHP